MTSSPLKFVLSERGKAKLTENGYIYTRDKLVGEVTHWKCEFWMNKRCPARVHTSNGEIVHRWKDHITHIGDAAADEAAEILTEIRKAAGSTLAPKVCVADAVATASQSALASLPTLNHVKRNVRNIRGRECDYPKLPGTRRDIEIPKSLLRTKNGKNFLLFDSGATDDRVMLFGTRKNLSVLQHCKLWLVDGTFKTSPKLFYQLYTIHGAYQGEIFPLVYALLPNKTAATYTCLFRELKALKLGLAPKVVLMDFDKAVMKAFKVSILVSFSCLYPPYSTKTISFQQLEFPLSRQQGCFFHLCQAIMRRINEIGLKIRYEKDSAFALRMRYLSALAFVPVPEVVTAFDVLLDAEIIPLEAQDVLEYFEDTWIGRHHRRG